MTQPFYFCMTCQNRIPLGQGVEKAEGLWYCQKCVNLPSPVVQRSTPTSGTAPAPAAPTTVAVATLAAPKTKTAAVLRPKPRTATRPETPPTEPKTSPFLYAGIGGGAACVLLLMYVLFGGSSKPAATVASAPKPTAVTREEHKTPDEPVVSNTLPTPVTATPPKQSDEGRVIPPIGEDKATDNDPRSAFAQREWTRLRESAKSNVEKPSFRKELESFVAKNGRTTAGKEAAEFLKALPKPETPAPVVPAANPDTPKAGQVLFNSNFDDPAEIKYIQEGTLDPNLKNGLTGASIRALPEKAPSDYFKGHFKIKTSAPIKVTENTYMRFACRLESGNQICIQTFAGSLFLEKWLPIKTGEWVTITFKLTDYTKNLRSTDPYAKTGWNFEGTFILGPGAMNIDNFEIVEGPL